MAVPRIEMDNDTRLLLMDACLLIGIVGGATLGIREIPDMVGKTGAFAVGILGCGIAMGADLERIQTKLNELKRKKK